MLLKIVFSFHSIFLLSIIFSADFFLFLFTAVGGVFQPRTSCRNFSACTSFPQPLSSDRQWAKNSRRGAKNCSHRKRFFLFLARRSSYYSLYSQLFHFRFHSASAGIGGVSRDWHKNTTRKKVTQTAVEKEDEKKFCRRFLFIFFVWPKIAKKIFLWSREIAKLVKFNLFIFLPFFSFFRAS